MPGPLSRPVVVVRDGRHLRGTLVWAYRTADGWRGIVHYSDPETLLSYYCAYDETELRRPVPGD